VFRFIRLAIVVCLLLPGATTVFATEQPSATTSNDGDEQFRKELSRFFASGEELSPTTLGALADSPEARTEIQQRIDALSTEELAAIREAFAAVPNWQVVPEALSSTLPSESLQQLTSLSGVATGEAEQLERFRAELSSLYAAIQLLPPEEQARLKLDRESLSVMQQDLHGMDVQGLSLARGALEDQAADWRQVRADTFAAMPPRVGVYAQRLAQHGPLSAKETEELEGFRDDLNAMFSDLARLRPELRQRFDAQAIDRTRQRLDAVTPEAMFVLREEIDSPALRQAMQEIHLLAEMGRPDPQRQAELEQYRSELQTIFSDLRSDYPDTPRYGQMAQQLDEMGQEELMLMQRRIGRIPGGERTVQRLLTLAASDTLRPDLESLASGTMSPEQMQELKSFRLELLDYYDALRQSDGIDPEAGDAAFRAVEQASLYDMVIMREVFSRLDRTQNDSAMLDLPVAVVEMGPEAVMGMVDINCVVSLGSIDLPLGIGNVSLGSINFNFLCDPLEDAINFATAAVDAVADVIDDVLQAVVNLPDTLLTALQSLFSSIANAALSAFSPANLQNALNLNGNFWENLPQVPQIPCPPDGTTIPFFGEVGEEETASKYGRYLWVFDKVLGLIPDTEVSLALKIPAQVLYAGVEYVGVCLEAAAELRASAETDAFRDSVTTGIDSAQVSINTVQTSIDQLALQLIAQGNDLSSQIWQAADDLGTQISQSGADIGDQLSDLDAHLLKLKIEENLLLQGQDRMSAFVRPETYGGRLELVREIVDEAIAMTEAAGGSVGCAVYELGQGDDAFSVAEYANAFDHYRKAYRDVAKASYVGDPSVPECPAK
jgi:hypothetical protein